MTNKRIKKTAKDSGGDIIQAYLREIEKIPVLSREEEVETVKLAIQGDKAARERLLKSNLRFVVMIAKKFQGKGLDLGDLINEGNLGMIYALKHYDADRGHRFISYAVWWIRQAIMKAIHEKGRMIQLPYNKSKELARLHRTKQLLQNGSNTEDGIQEIAAFLNISRENAAELMQMGRSVISLDDLAFRSSDEISTIKDYIEDNNSVSPPEYAMNCVLKDDLDEALQGLEKRDAEILRCRYGLGETGAMTLDEVGYLYNLSRERVRQIELRALRQLEYSSNGKLRSYTA